MRTPLLALLTCALLSGCATTYVGPQPDFTKTGAEAQAEYEKFRVGTAYGNLNHYAVKMGGQTYYLESVEPILNNVSPTSASKLQKMKVGNYMSLAIFAATISALNQPRDSWAKNTGYYVGLAGILGTGIYINLSGMGVAEDYNKDLKSRFSPSLAFSKTF